MAGEPVLEYLEKELAVLKNSTPDILKNLQSAQSVCRQWQDKYDTHLAKIDSFERTIAQVNGRNGAFGVVHLEL